MPSYLLSSAFTMRAFSSETHPLRVCLLPFMPMQVHPEVFCLSPIHVHRHVRSCSHWRVPMLRAMVPIERSSFPDHFEAPRNFTGQAPDSPPHFFASSVRFDEPPISDFHHHSSLACMGFFLSPRLPGASAAGNYNSQCPGFCLVRSATLNPVFVT